MTTSINNTPAPTSIIIDGKIALCDFFAELRDYRAALAAAGTPMCDDEAQARIDVAFLAYRSSEPVEVSTSSPTWTYDGVTRPAWAYGDHLPSNHFARWTKHADRYVLNHRFISVEVKHADGRAETLSKVETFTLTPMEVAMWIMHSDEWCDSGEDGTIELWWWHHVGRVEADYREKYPEAQWVRAFINEDTHPSEVDRTPSP